MYPMIGSTRRPGIIQSDATEKPIDRARGGIARLSAAKMPGARIATEPGDREVDADRDVEVGHRREEHERRAHDVRDVREELEDLGRAALGHRRVAMRAPRTSPISCAGSTHAAMMPRARSSRSYTCS